jgi:hypothetical protein
MDITNAKNIDNHTMIFLECNVHRTHCHCAITDNLRLGNLCPNTKLMLTVVRLCALETWIENKVPKSFVKHLITIYMHNCTL